MIYILEGKRPIKTDSSMIWAKWFKTANRTVKKTTIGEVTVSTVFLGVEHGFSNGKPLLFETIIFGGKFDGEIDRYTSYAEAEEGHKKTVVLCT